MRRMRRPGDPVAQPAQQQEQAPPSVVSLLGFQEVKEGQPIAPPPIEVNPNDGIQQEKYSAVKVGEKAMKPELQRLVEVAFTNRDEITKVYLDAREWLKPMDVGEVGHKLNVGESLLHELTRAALSAKLQRTEWEIENTIAFGAMRLDATERLTSERAAQTKAKAITEKDLEAKLLALYPDAYKQQEIERERVQRAVELVDAMQDHVASRIKTLQGMMAKGR